LAQDARSDVELRIVKLATASLADLTREPEATRFRKIEIQRFDTITTRVCGEVNAKNAFGGYNGYKPFFSLIDVRKYEVIYSTVGETDFDKERVTATCNGKVGIKLTPDRLADALNGNWTAADWRPPIDTFGVAELAQRWRKSFAACREGRPEAPSTITACDDEHSVQLEMDRRGWCFGRVSDPAQYLHAWHLCQTDSFHPNKP
jgi:hypothetical protein